MDDLSKEVVFIKSGITMEAEMQKNQNGFIPMLVLLLIILGVVIWQVYTRVHSAQN